MAYAHAYGPAQSAVTLIERDKPVLAFFGMTPCLLGNLAKVLFATALLPRIWKFLKP